MSPTIEIFRALSDPSRLRIVQLVRSCELAVGELAQLLGQSVPRMSRHLTVLEDAGLVQRRKEGAWVFVRLAEPGRIGQLLEAIDALQTSEEERALAAADQGRIEGLQRERAALAEAWFAQHAPRWDMMRGLHVDDAVIDAAMRKHLAGRPIGRLVDLGTGTGRMLELFAGAASSAIGIDRSPEMLRLARVKLQKAGIAADLHHGDAHSLPLAPASADTILMHQVLHYAHAPAQAIREAARILAPSGRLLIVDVAAHQLEDLRRQFAHQWLGFADDQVEQWIAAAELRLLTSESLPGQPLEVKLWSAAKA